MLRGLLVNAVEAAALQCLFLFNIFIHKTEQGTDSTVMKFTDGTHLGDIMNTRDIRKMIQKGTRDGITMSLDFKNTQQCVWMKKKKQKPQHLNKGEKIKSILKLTSGGILKVNLRVLLNIPVTSLVCFSMFPLLKVICLPICFHTLIGHKILINGHLFCLSPTDSTVMGLHS